MVVVVALAVLYAAWMAGREYQSRQDAREHLAVMVGAFAAWAEAMLASAPDELNPEQEEARAHLQRDYQHAQRLLRELEG